MFLDIPRVLDRLSYRYPSLLVDAVTEHDPGSRMVAVKNVTANEEYFQGHFPGTPLMPGVMMIESLAQVATLLLLADDSDDGVRDARAVLRRVDNAKFRRQVLPGDQLNLEVVVGKRSTEEAVVHGVAKTDNQVVAEADLLIGFEYDAAEIHDTAIVHPGAVIGAGTVVGPYAVIGHGVRLGERCRVGASAVLDGDTETGSGCQFFPFTSIGLIPQDLKFRGEKTRLVIGHRNVFREGVTVHRGTRGGGGLTLIGDDNVFMAYAHVAHDCIVGNRNIFGNGATLGGHVVVGRRSGRQCVLRCASVLSGGSPGLCRRIFRHYQGCRALWPDRWEPRPHLRSQYDRPRSARVFARNDRQAQEGVSVSAAVEAQHHQRPTAHRDRPVIEVPGGRLLAGIYPDVEAGRQPATSVAADGTGRGRGVIPPETAVKSPIAANAPTMRIGLIAGNGRFPFLVLDAARSLGHEVTVVAIREEADSELEAAATAAPGTEVHWVSLGQLGRCISILKDAGVSRALMAGQVKHTKLFAGVLPDLTLLSVLSRLRTRNTDALISAVADVLEENGIELVNSTSFLEPLLAAGGALTRRAPTADEGADLGVRLHDGGCRGRAGYRPDHRP